MMQADREWIELDARLAARRGPLGYLARELPGEIPALMKKLRGRLSPRQAGPGE